MSTGSSPPTLFINYRREDTAPYAGRLYDRLRAHFGEDQVFIDIDQIEPGEDFVEAINRKVSACDIAIVSIGPDWLEAKDALGQRRLDDTEDFVRMEIIAALERKIRVIPILVGGAEMPRKQDLPEALAALSRRNALELSETRFHADVDRLIEAIEKPRTLPEKKSATTTPIPPPVATTLSGPARENVTRSSAPISSAAFPSILTPALRNILIAGGLFLVLASGVWFFGSRDSHPVGPVDAVSVTPTTSASDGENAPNAMNLSKNASFSNAASEKNLAAEYNPAYVGKAGLDTAPSETSYQDEWLRRVRQRAEEESADAQFEMGAFYESGFGSLAADLDQALAWYRKAAARGHTLAKEAVEDLPRASAAASELEAAKLDTRRLTRQQLSTNGFLNEMHTKAMEAIKDIKK